LFLQKCAPSEPGQVILFFLPEKTIMAGLKIFNKLLCGVQWYKKKGPADAGPFF
jgi:hypothetical protein